MSEIQKEIDRLRARLLGVPQVEDPADRGDPDHEEVEAFDPLRPGDTFHLLRPLTVSFGTEWAARSEVLPRGTTLVADADLLEAGLDRLGRSIYQLVDDEQAQILKYGERVIARGPWPEDERKQTRGTPDWDAGREAARQLALAIEDRAARVKALAAVSREWGTTHTSQQLAYYGGDKEREAGDAARLAADLSHYRSVTGDEPGDAA